ncbi:leucine-rich repeat neuronal protein 1-like isoform X2 [Eriocheir sinensis]|uniref:leucine-rich repeat neuronal protein 1-like isoform X2 n=1 Tax=Eriocheir sinensis TaxID=95602 RepID=UPI0021C8E5A8|nr:leucine-rich repeat neuronal protein 1-like isoform X2 [Eriocheir sinensis]
MPNRMKIWAVAVAVMVAALAGAAAGQRQDMNSPVCTQCECLMTMPLDVDCSHTALEQVPDLSQDSFTMPVRLDLSNNMIHRVTKFANVTHLVTLLLRHNQISSIEDGAFRDLPHLRSLSLQGNNLTKESLTERTFKGLYNDTHPTPIPVEEMDLSYNQLHDLDSHAFKHLPFLKRLFLSNNPILDIGRGMASAISELSSLQELDLSQTGLQRLPDHFLSGFRYLRVLTLAGNMFTSVPSELGFARNLEVLNLNANPITRISAGDFPENLSTLRKLELSAMPNLRSVGQQSFSYLSGLGVLHLSDNPVLAVIDKEAFMILSDKDLALEEIHLQDNRLTTLEEGMLPWLDLTLVDLQNNPWNCDCNLQWVAERLIPDLQQKNPQTTLSLMCAEPIADRGMKIEDLLGRAHTFECRAPDPFSRHEGRYGPLIVGTIVVGTILLITGTIIFVFVLYRRNREHQLFGERVKYRRAQDEEEDGVTPTVSS